MKQVKVTYRNGYPSMNCIHNLIDCYFKGVLDINNVYFMCPNISISGSIHWQRNNINEHLDSFVGFLIENGLDVKDYRAYESPRTGSITFNKKK